MSEIMESAPHRLINDREILDRLVQTRKEIESEGRLFYRAELVFISDLIGECKRRGMLVKTTCERLAQVERCQLCAGYGSLRGERCLDCDGTGLAYENGQAALRALGESHED